MNEARDLSECHCLTCADEAVPMWVLELDGEVAVCRDEQGARHQVALDFVAPVRAGQRVLVHAGVAIA